ncbi:MAG: HD domain-containing protein [Candidatus Saccharibacteria bacterium]
MDSIFNGDSFSQESMDLYDNVISDKQVEHVLGNVHKHDHLTEYHSRGVSHIVSEYVVQGVIDRNHEESKALIRMAVLHDIGKLSILKSILDKPGKLSKNEWQLVENHPIDGFHHYALDFDAYEALPILIHHTMQPNYYPSVAKINENASIYGISKKDLTEEMLLEDCLTLAVADNIEARYPHTDLQNESPHIRKYGGRRYAVDDLPDLVRASFIESGKVKRLNLVDLLDSLLETSRETFLRK